VIIVAVGNKVDLLFKIAFFLFSTAVIAIGYRFADGYIKVEFASGYHWLEKVNIIVFGVTLGLVVIKPLSEILRKK
jgi:hypothetical protein